MLQEHPAATEAPPAKQTAEEEGQQEKAALAGAKRAPEEKTELPPPAVAQEPQPPLVPAPAPATPRETTQRPRCTSSKGSQGEDSAGEEQDLDIAKSDGVLKPIQAVPGILAHTVGNILGGATLAAGWGLGKADAAASKVGLSKTSQVSDSAPFKMGFRAWLYANGIWPTVLCETGPYGNDFGPLPQDPQARARMLRSTALIVSNHVSYIDTLVLPAVLEVPKLLAMTEVASWPLFGQLCQEMDMIWVDRSDPNSRAAAKEAISEHVQSWSDGERPLLMWPEGLCSNGRGLKDFRSGAFAPGKAVRPVLILYTGEWDPANVNFREEPTGDCGNSQSNAVGYGDAEWAQQFLGHMIHSCTVLVCRPYHPSKEEVADPELFKTNVRELMHQRLEELQEHERRRRDGRRANPARGMLAGMDKLIGIAGRSIAQGAQGATDIAAGRPPAWLERIMA